MSTYFTNTYFFKNLNDNNIDIILLNYTIQILNNLLLWLCDTFFEI